MPPSSNLLTVAQFAAYWNCSQWSVFQLLKKGLPSIKRPGLGRRILRAEADAWILTEAANRPAKVRARRKMSSGTDAKVK